MEKKLEKALVAVKKLRTQLESGKMKGSATEKAAAKAWLLEVELGLASASSSVKASGSALPKASASPSVSGSASAKPSSLS